MKRAFSLYILLAAVSGLQAQGHGIRIEPGFFMNMYRDETASPLLYETKSFGINLSYSFEDPSFRHELTAKFSMGPALSSISAIPVKSRYYDQETGSIRETLDLRNTLHVLASIEYSCLFGNWDGAAFSFLPGIGGDFNLFMQFAHYPTISGYFSLGPALGGKAAFSPSDSVEAAMYAPLLNYIVRPPYAGSDDEVMSLAAQNPALVTLLGHFATLNEYAKLAVQVRYTRRFSEHLEADIKTYAHFAYTAVPRPRREIFSQTSAGIQYRF